MQDSLSQSINSGATIPDLNTRVVFLVVVAFIVAIGIALTYFRTKEADGLIKKE